MSTMEPRAGSAKMDQRSGSTNIGQRGSSTKMDPRAGSAKLDPQQQPAETQQPMDQRSGSLSMNQRNSSLNKAGLDDMQVKTFPDKKGGAAPAPGVLYAPSRTGYTDTNVGKQHLEKAEAKFLKTWQSWVVQKQIKEFPLEMNLEGSDLADRGFFLKSSPFAVVYLKGPHENDPWEKFGDTEAIENVDNPKFVASFRMACTTEDDKNQGLRVDFYNRAHKDKDDYQKQDFIGSAVCTLNDVLSANAQSLTLELKHPSKAGFRGNATLYIDTLMIKEPPVEITIEVKAAGPSTEKRKAYFVISRALRKGNWTPVYMSEVSKDKKLTEWEQITLTQERLMAGADDRAFRVEIYVKHLIGKDEMVGSFSSKYESLRKMSPGGHLPFISIKEGMLQTGVIVESVECSELKGHISFKVVE
eukprot:CAMPEP_0184695914 /NCGR_PEP_ID=MMETSP0313-20130426/3384_1 /TAXON_ID=2792 /ORGANISM="Porphyridium aerugineum, Strain SAG 1380-2" /LENGTH=414 /DNA_ID=CAMNT_0027154441 /DNA_START=147 /DNA_END=1391 /DNA_ORIENTATION=-